MRPQDQKRLEVLQDTVKHYSKDVTLRCVGGRDRITCSYSNVNAINKKSKGCAVGRLIPLKLRKQWDTAYKSKGIRYLSTVTKLPANLLELGVNFLEDLQELHDHPKNWNSTGLTLTGDDIVERITSRIEGEFYD